MLGFQQVLAVTDHVDMDCEPEPFWTQETVARADWYGVQGVPDVRIDGKYDVLGAESCDGAFLAYDSLVLQRLKETGGVSPISIVGYWEVGSGQVEMTARFTLCDPITPTPLRATLLIYENGIQASGYGYYGTTWNKVTRRILDRTITLVSPGDADTVTMSVPCDASWNPANLQVIAYVQRLTPDKEVLQSGLLVNSPSAVAVSPPAAPGWMEAPRPNPFRDYTDIVFNVPPQAGQSPFRLEIFDSSGRRITSLAEGPLAPGRYSRRWDGRSAGGSRAESGIYFARLTGTGRQFLQKLILLN